MEHLKKTSVLAASLGTLAATIAIVGIPSMLVQIADLESTLNAEMHDYNSMTRDMEMKLKHMETPDVARYKRQVRTDARQGMCPGGSQPLTTRHGQLIECKTSFCVQGFRCMPDATCCPINVPLPDKPIIPTIIRERVPRPLKEPERKSQPVIRQVGGAYVQPTTTTTTTPAPQPAYSAAVDSQPEASGNCNCQDEPRDCPAGPKGAPGAAGQDGEDGKDGENGRPGLDAEPLPESCGRDPVCEPCPPGAQGRPGPKGKGGRPGNNGRNGSNGRPGKNGNKGNPGAAGSPGKGGPKGGPGKKGPTGKDGVKAATGGPGRKGSTGAKGPKGPPGSPGRSVSGRGGTGDKGSVGAVGPAGPSGPAGGPGTGGGKGRPGNDAEYCPCPPRRNGGSNARQQFNQRRRNFSFRGFNNKKA